MAYTLEPLSDREIIEGNVFIATFMGYNVIKENNEFKVEYSKNCWDRVETWARYDISWDWLIPVLQKLYLELPTERWEKIQKALLMLNISEVWKLAANAAYYCNNHK